MPTKRSAGILLYRRTTAGLEVLVGHMGGPYWVGKDAGAWSIPKGEYDADEEPLAAARREFQEEIGHPVPADALMDLGSVRQSGGKTVSVWAAEGDLDASTAVSTTFELEWPPGSGQLQEYPEIDRAAWFPLPVAAGKLVRAQREFLDRLTVAAAATHPGTGASAR